MFTAEYQNIHDSGKATQGLIVAAEIVSCAKRSIARLDFEGKVIIVDETVIILESW